MNSKMRSYIYSQVIYWGTALSQVHSLQTLPFIDQFSSKIEVSSLDFTRIKIKDDRIKQLFGQTDSLIMEIDDELGQIFIKPRLNSKKAIRITLVTENGLTHDLKLIPKNQEAESILFTPRNQLQDGKNKAVPLIHCDDNLTNRNQIIQLIQNLSHRIQNISARQLSSMHFVNNPNLEIKTITEQQQRMYHIEAFEITNITNSPVLLDPVQFYKPPTIAIAFGKRFLAPQTSTFLYIIMENSYESTKPLY